MGVAMAAAAVAVTVVACGVVVAAAIAITIAITRAGAGALSLVAHTVKLAEQLVFGDEGCHLYLQLHDLPLELLLPTTSCCSITALLSLFRSPLKNGLC